jgi:hypothetical protein
MTSKVKVNTVETESGSTLTLGKSGDTVTLASGASQSGFGRTGTVDWDTTKKTASFTAVSGNGYFVDTTSAAITVTLPASPSAGDIVGIADYARTFATNNLTVARNGSNIQGASANGTINLAGQSTMFVYVDATQGWIPTEDQTTNNYGSDFIVASGGTVTTCGNCKIHTFTSPGNFTVSCISSNSANNQVSYMVVAGGGGAGRDRGGGAGAGGFREDKSPVTPYTASPLEGAGAITVSQTTYPITVGAGGTGGPTASPCGTNGRGTAGSNSVFSTITSAGGGTSGPGDSPTEARHGGDGGSGGGGGAGNSAGGNAGTGNTPPVTPSQGSNGGSSGGAGTESNRLGAGGGGATAAGTNGVPGGNGNGGAGATTSISGSSTTYAGGGGGGIPTGTAGSGGSGGGGDGSSSSATGSAGTANTGGGGGGGGNNCSVGGAGGSGIVIIRYKYQ